MSIDSELVRDIDIVRGSDAFNSGSGALGGGVNYHTLDAQDIVKSNNKFGALLRGGYGSKNSEWVRTLGFGYVGDKVDAIFMYSQRTGHQMKSKERVLSLTTRKANIQILLLTVFIVI